MPDTIRDGVGNAYLAEVDKNHRLQTRSISESIQHNISIEDEQAYQCPSAATNLAAGTTVAFHIKNISTNKNIVVTYIRHQIVSASGGTSFPNVNNYFRVVFGREYSSGGSVCTPVNMHAGSGNDAEVEAYIGNPTLTGTASEFDRWYTKQDGDMNTYNKEGSLIIPPNQTMELSYIGDHTSGIISTRLSFLMKRI